MAPNIDVKQMFVESNALLKGHFVLSSGLHSDTYMQSALVLKNPKNSELLGKLLSEKIKEQVSEIDLVVAPAMGGVIIGHETARAFEKEFIFTERVNGSMVLRRGFHIPKNSRIIIIEDVFTTGKSTREVIALLKENGADVKACASLVDRSSGSVKFDIPSVSLLSLDIKNYEESSCPMCKQGIPVEKPGSRFLNNSK